LSGVFWRRVLEENIYLLFFLNSEFRNVNSHIPNKLREENKMYKLYRNGKEIHEGTWEECFEKWMPEDFIVEKERSFDEKSWAENQIKALARHNKV